MIGFGIIILLIMFTISTINNIQMVSLIINK